MRTPTEILKLAGLAKLSISSEELPLVVGELEQLLRFAEELPDCPPEISSENLPEAAQPQMEWREDEPAQGLSQQEALQNAQRREMGFFLALDGTAEGEAQ